MKQNRPAAAVAILLSERATWPTMTPVVDTLLLDSEEAGHRHSSYDQCQEGREQLIKHDGRMHRRDSCLITGSSASGQLTFVTGQIVSDDFGRMGLELSGSQNPSTKSLTRSPNAPAIFTRSSTEGDSTPLSIRLINTVDKSTTSANCC